MTANQTVRLRVASASLNQTVYDFSTNVPNILKAIDKAVEDGADILALEELGLTGYAADDYHQWNKTNDVVWPYIDLIAKYANDKDPNLVISLGTPWHYANKQKPANDPEYNINNRPFNTQMTITGGEVVAIAAKSILADGPAEYETRQFNDWPFEKGTITIELPNGLKVPFGKPVVALGSGKKLITLTHEICAEGWPGVGDDLSINRYEQEGARHIVELAKRHDLSVVLNPSASKPQPSIGKERIRAEGLCVTGSEYCGLFVYTNFLGSGSGTYAAEGSQIYAQSFETIHHGKRYTFQDVSYSSATVELPLAKRGKPHATAHHDFIGKELTVAGTEANFDIANNNGDLTPDKLAIEEYARSISLWLRDYMNKQPWPCQGFVISLSGGKDSAYGACANSMMVELEVKENGIEGFFDHFPKLKCRDEVLKIYKEQGEEAAIEAIKSAIFTYVYLPTDNSSDRTQNAARFLIEGGKLPDGQEVKGIGGKFYVAPVQGALEEMLIAYTGLNVSKVAADHVDEIVPAGRYQGLTNEERQILARGKITSLIKSYVNASANNIPELPEYITANCINPIPTWANPADDITLQNIQARVRLPIPWAVANQEGKIALVTSNESEAVLGYTTAGGDMHMGGANPIGGLPKDTITASLVYFAENGLIGLQPVQSLFYVNNEAASAELRKVDENTAPQTDESDLGFTYRQSAFLERELLVGRKTPSSVLHEMQNSPLFPDGAAANRTILISFANRWESAQFKRVMGTLAPHVGGNVDPHQAVRTTVLGDHFKTGCAHMTLEAIAETVGENNFQNQFGVSVADAKFVAGLNPGFKSALIKWPIEKLMQPNQLMKLIEESSALLRYAPSHAKRSTITPTNNPAPRLVA